MDAKQIDDHVFEALFRQAIIDDYTEEIESTPPNEKLREMLSFSAEFELKMKRLLVREQRKETLSKVLKFTKRVAAVFIIVTSISFCMLLFNYEVRAAVKNTVIEWYDKFTTFIFQGEKSNSGQHKEWRPQYIPAGYLEITVEKIGKATDIEYTSDEGNVIHFSYRPKENDTTINVDNENHTIESRTINGYETYIIEAIIDDFENGIIWSTDDYTFNIWSVLPVEELIKVAQSIN